MDMNEPIFPAPPGYIVDVDNPQRTGEAANFWIGTLGMIIAAIFMAIRVYTKARLAKNFTSDDIALLIAWCFSIAIQVPILCASTKAHYHYPKSNHLAVQYGRGTLGVHIWELTGHRVNSTMNVSTTNPSKHQANPN
ncbi:uncharacterized protein J4E78_009655 [Alternaria triticimaculans]|uniref:uncharacterized protein n=1 Tax=Alternaria triticimaculans TaxID=297637 RepID=UPI0020C415C6|nr:uncharacterized protein J4E78_009655 [Alternaria triticimaculans]KAI4644072.1 hypothetical protein J4E78_009655 [Alternaria triticimaculans]